MDEKLEKMAPPKRAKFCPLIKEKCAEEECAWWSESCGTCAMHNLESIEK